MLFGSVLAVQALTGSLVAAGIAGGLLNLGNMIGLLFKGKMLDHYDKAWVFFPCALLTLASATPLALSESVSVPVALALIFCLGLVLPPVDIWMRAAWGRIYPDNDAARHLASGWETLTSYVVTLVGSAILALVTWISDAPTALLVGAVLQALAAIGVSMIPLVRRVARPSIHTGRSTPIVRKLWLIKSMPNASQASQRVALVAAALAIGVQQADSFTAVCVTLIALSGTLQLLYAGAPRADALSVQGWTRGLLFAAAPVLLLIVAMLVGWVMMILAMGGLLIYSLLAGYYESRIARVGLYMLERHTPAGYHNRSFATSGVIGSLAYLAGSAVAGVLSEYTLYGTLLLPGAWLCFAAWYARWSLGYLDQETNGEKASG